MAIILAANTGNWSATSTWTGGVVPVAGDVVVANNKTITMDTLNITVAELRNDTTGGAVAGGWFACVNGNNINANVYSGSTTNSCVLWSGSTGQTVTITGQFFAGTYSAAANGDAIYCGGGNLVIGGGSSSTGGTGTAQSSGIQFASTGTFTFATSGNPGTITGGTSSNAAANGVRCSAVGSNITIYATTISGNTSGNGYGLNCFNTSQTISIYATTISSGLSGATGIGANLNANNQTISITATNIGLANSTTYALYLGGASSNVTLNAVNIGTPTSVGTVIYMTTNSGNHTYTISGNIYGPTSGSFYGIQNIGGSNVTNITIAGTMIGGTGSGSPALFNQGNSTVNITGNIVGPTSGSNSVPITNISSGTINITGYVSAGNANNGISNSSTGIVRVTRAIGNAFGVGSVNFSNAYALSTSQNAFTYVKQLVFGSLGQPPITGPTILTDDTTNTVQFYKEGGGTKTLVDTAATSGVLPAAADVRTGVVYSSGNRTGTCAVPAAGSVALGVAVDNTTGTAVLTVANVQTALTSQGLTTTRAEYLDNIATAPPSAASIAAAVWANATRTLTTAIDNSATIAAAVWSYATGRTITGGTVDTLTNAPSVPSAATIASAVRTELTTELGRIDTTISSRMAANSYTTPPTAAANASAVRTALSPELARMANAATVENVAVIVEGVALTNVESGTLDGGSP